jgi:tetratricopeptide (TPR) repeat protein
LYVFATILFVAALLSKTVTCSIPVVVLLLLWYRKSPALNKAALWMIPWLAMGAASGLLTAYLERVHVGARGAPFTFSMFERVVIAGRAVWFYWQKLVWPQPLVFMYPRWKPSEFGWLDLTYPVSVVVLLIALCMLILRWGRGPLVAACCFLVSIFPALGFINIYPMRYSFVADHFQYLASIGPIALLAACATLLAQRYAQSDQSKQRFTRAVLSAPILIMMALTWLQTHDYHDLETLWTRTLYKNPTSFVACFYLSRIRESQQRYEEATELLLQASELQTDDMARDVYEALIGHGLNRQGRTEEAKTHFEKSLEWNAENFDALTGLATLLSRNSATDEAIPLYRRAIQVNPTHVAVRTNFATALVTSGDLAAAEQEYLVAIKLEPNALLSRLSLGSLYARQGRLKEAEQQFLFATKIDPTSQDAAKLLARVRADQK